MKKRLILSLGLLGVMTASMLGGTAFARDHHYNRGNWGNHYSNNWNRGNWGQGNWNRGNWNRGNWNRGNWGRNNWGHNNWNRNVGWWGNGNHHRMAYRPGNHWGNYGHVPRRGGWW